MSADAIVKSFIDRILRLKEEQDALSADIREVYAEAKGNGYDKTAMGEVVAYLRKIEKKGKDAVDERSAMFDLYLDAYERPSHTHAREASQSYAEAKGVERPAQKIKEGLKEALAVAKGEAEPARWHPATDTQEQPEPGADFNNGEDHDADSRQHVGRQDDEQRGSAPVSSSVGRGESTDDGDQGQGAGASGTDRGVGTVEGELDCQDQDGRSGHVGGEVDHEVAPSDGDTFVAVKGSALFLTNAAGVEPSPSVSIPHSAVPPLPADKTGAAPLPSNAAPVEISDEDVPAFLRKERKPLRPNCQHPDNCAGYGTHTCHSCTVAAREVEPA